MNIIAHILCKTFANGLAKLRQQMWLKWCGVKIASTQSNTVMLRQSVNITAQYPCNITVADSSVPVGREERIYWNGYTEVMTMNKVYEERIDNKYRYFVGEETKDKDGIKKFVHKSGYFKTRKDAEKRLKEMERM